MKKTLTALALLALTALTASAKPTEVSWIKGKDGAMDVYTSNEVKGDFTANLKHQGRSILKKDKSFSISITTTSDARKFHKGFANEFGVGLLATDDPYAEPITHADDNQFGIYVGCGKVLNFWPYNDQRKVELHFNKENYKVENYALNHENDGQKDTLTLSFTLHYTAADPEKGRKAKMELSANPGSDVTFDTLTIDNPSTGVLFPTLQNGGTISSAPKSKTHLKISVETDRIVLTSTHYVLAGLALAAVILIGLAGASGKRKDH